MLARAAGSAAAGPRGARRSGGHAATPASHPWRRRLARVAAAANDPTTTTATTTTVTPQQHQPLAFSFSAGGLLFPYHWGVATELVNQGALDRASTPLAGASAGSIIVACLRSGLPFDRVTDACLSLAADCRAKGTRSRLGPVLEAMLRELLPDDVHERCSAGGGGGGGAHIAVTRLFPRPLDASAAPDLSLSVPSSPLSSFDAGGTAGAGGGGPAGAAAAAAAAVASRLVRPELLHAYSSRDDLIGAVLTSSHIPWYLNGSPTRTFRGGECLDGGLTQFIPSIPGCYTSGGSSSSSGSGTSGSGTSGSDSEEEEGAAFRQPRLVRVTCFPSRAMDAAVQRAARLLGPEGGAVGAGRSAEAAAAAAAERAALDGHEAPRFADLSPDRFGEWGVTLREAIAMAFEPAPEETLLALLDKGREDARAWLAAAGTSSGGGGGGGGGGGRR